MADEQMQFMANSLPTENVNPALEDMANRIAANMVKNDVPKAEIDPFTIYMIICIIIDLIRIWIACHRSHQEVRTIAANPTRPQYILVARQTMKTLGVIKFAKVGMGVVKGVFDVASQLNDDEIQALLSSVEI